jgi:hypothetical protein
MPRFARASSLQAVVVFIFVSVVGRKGKGSGLTQHNSPCADIRGAGTPGGAVGRLPSCRCAKNTYNIARCAATSKCRTTHGKTEHGISSPKNEGVRSSPNSK